MRKVTMELTERQLQVMMQALDAYCRLGLGQLRYACENLALQNRNDEDWERVEARFKATMCPNHPLPGHGSLGISNRLVPEDAKIARDLHHTMMHKRGSNINQGWNVYSSDEIQFSQEPKAKIEVL